MSKGLKTLIRVAEWEVDKERRLLAIKINILDSLNQKLSYLETELKTALQSYKSKYVLVGWTKLGNLELQKNLYQDK